MIRLSKYEKIVKIEKGVRQGDMIHSLPRKDFQVAELERERLKINEGYSNYLLFADIIILTSQACKTCLVISTRKASR